jgi:hypothetical protein
MILVSAAGNEGSTTNDSEFPSNCAGVISVGAYGAYGTGGTQIKAWPDSQRQSYVSLAGPGIKMIGYAPSGTTYGTGTSDAAAIVSGSIADVRARFPSMPSRQLVARMIATARQFQGAKGTHNSVFGWGAARPHHAITDTVPANAPNPIYDKLDKIGGGQSSGEAPTSNPPTNGTTINAPGPSSSGALAGGSGSGSSSSSSGVIIGVLVAVLIIAAIVITVLVRGRRNPARLR